MLRHVICKNKEQKMTSLLKLATLLVISITLAGCDQADRDDSGDIVTSGDLDVFSLKVGDCTNDPADQYEEELFSVDAVPCSEPHDNEFYAAVNVSYDEFPGDAALSAEAEAICLDSFEAFAGIGYESSVLDVFPMHPTQGSWDEGDREIICAVYHVDLEKLTGSVKGLGI
jgi:hypothetical protein